MIYYFFHKKFIHSLEFKLWVQQMNRKAFISLELHRNAEKKTYIWASCDFICHADLNRWLSKHGCWYLLSFNTCWRCLQFNCQTEAVIRCKTPVSANILCSNFVAGGLCCHQAQTRAWWIWRHSAWLFLISTEIALMQRQLNNPLKCHCRLEKRQTTKTFDKKYSSLTTLQSFRKLLK